MKFIYKNQLYVIGEIVNPLEASDSYEVMAVMKVNGGKLSNEDVKELKGKDLEEYTINELVDNAANNPKMFNIIGYFWKKGDDSEAGLEKAAIKLIEDSRPVKEAVCKDYKIINHTDDELEVLDEDIEDDELDYVELEIDSEVLDLIERGLLDEAEVIEFVKFCLGDEKLPVRYEYASSSQLHPNDYLVIGTRKDNPEMPKIDWNDLTYDIKDDGYYYYDPEEPDINLFKDYDEDDEDFEVDPDIFEKPVRKPKKVLRPEEVQDRIVKSADNLLIDGLREELEENEDEVECQGCFDTFNKADCYKFSDGYYCPGCAKEHEREGNELTPLEDEFENDITDEAFSPRVPRVKVGDTIEIIDMDGEPRYSGRTGVVEYIDDAGQIHGTWGGCAIIPEADEFKVIKRA